MGNSAIESIISTLAPWLVAGLTGGPAGIAMKAAGTIAGALGLDSSSATSSSITSALQNITLTPEQQTALAQAEQTFQLQMKQAGYADKEALQKLDLEQIAAINATMVAELQAGDKAAWLERSWRPLCGMTVACGSFLSVVGAGGIFAYAVITKQMDALSKIPDFASAMALILAVPGSAVGITAWHQGVKDVKTVTSGASPTAAINTGS